MKEGTIRYAKTGMATKTWKYDKSVEGKDSEKGEREKRLIKIDYRKTFWGGRGEYYTLS